MNAPNSLTPNAYPETPMNNVQIQLDDCRKLAEDVVNCCKVFGVHLTIESKSLTPLAMGNLDMVVNVRPARILLQPADISSSEPTGSARATEAGRMLQEICHGAAREAGWWIDPSTSQSITTNPYCFSNKLCLVHSEISEAMEGDRKSLQDDKLPHREMREVELADALIRCFDLAGAYGMDLGAAIAEKLELNAHRPDHQLAVRAQAGGKSY